MANCGAASTLFNSVPGTGTWGLGGSSPSKGVALPRRRCLRADVLVCTVIHGGGRRQVRGWETGGGIFLLTVLGPTNLTFHIKPHFPALSSLSFTKTDYFLLPKSPRVSPCLYLSLGFFPPLKYLFLPSLVTSLWFPPNINFMCLFLNNLSFPPFRRHCLLPLNVFA